MNLQKILINLILEFKEKTTYLPQIEKGDKIINIGVTYEQDELRSGSLNPLLPKNSYSLMKIINGEWESGVYNYWIRDVVEKNFDKVFDSVIYLDKNMDKVKRNRILFIGRNEYMDGIEFITDFEVFSENEIGLRVITSAMSKENRNFFFNKEKDPEIKIMKENFEKFTQIYLYN
jgi:hypothetical protein